VLQKVQARSGSLASAWLISQFIDKRPRFYFASDSKTVEGAIPFDIFGAE
jgi:hypothetical protein